jgi:hypothetical protein
MEGLGRLFNVVYPADDVYVSLKDAAAVTFVVSETDGATSATITFSNNAAGGSTATPDVIDHLYESATDVAGGKWTRIDFTASETFLKTDTNDLAVVTVDASMCPDGKPYVKCTADGSALVTAILHDLLYQRSPTVLVNPRV